MSQSTIETSFAAIDRASPADYAADTARLSAATRYLAAAAYTDKQFRAKVIEMDEDEFRARAPELGIDARLVVEHCYTARRRLAWRDAALCLVLVAVACTGIIGDVWSYPEETPLILAYYAVPLVLCWVLAAAIVFVDIFRTQYVTLTRRFAPNAFAPAPGTSARTSMNPGNVVVYGAFSPFVGAGFDLGGWSFAVNLEQAKLDFAGRKPEGFEVGELYRMLRTGFERLGIDGLAIKDRLFVDGRAIRNDRRFLPALFSRPLGTADSSLVDAYLAEPTRTARHYLCLEISDWSGELVLSTFIRFHKSASKLFIEVSNFILPPLKSQYYDLDKRTSLGLPGKIFGWLVQAAIAGPILALVAPFTTWQTLCRPLASIAAHGRRRREAESDPLYNYGARQSIRELGTANAWRVYFQKLDTEMHGKVVQQQLLDVLISFLDDHGVDTSEIKDRGSHILNSGVIVTGGAINAESLAVGEGAKASAAKAPRRKTKAAA